MLNFFTWYLPENVNMFGNGARMKLSIKYKLLFLDPLCTVGWMSIAAHAYNISQFFITVLISSLCQSIEYQDAHVNLLTESIVTLNSLCNFTPVGKELSIG